MNALQTRRTFLKQVSLSAAALGTWPRTLVASPDASPASDVASFFLVGDTHYCVEENEISRMKPDSAKQNARLVDWLNKLPGTDFSSEAGGGSVPVPHGVIHAGDLVDNGDKAGARLKMAEPEMAAFVADWGLNGGDAKLRWAVREVHGNHDGPRGDTVVVDEIKARNRRRAGLTNVSPNGLHYSWDWADVHFVALGIVVGDAPEVIRKRRYAPFGSLPFLVQDLAENVGKSGRPVVIIHHIDVARYSQPVPDDRVVHNEWDYGDVHAYYAAIKPYRIAAAVCGHTHARNIFRWDGTKDMRATQGIPFLNTDNAAHFSGPAQAFLHVEITRRELRVREFATKDGWQTGTWTPQVWNFDLNV